MLDSVSAIYVAAPFVFVGVLAALSGICEYAMEKNSD